MTPACGKCPLCYETVRGAISDGLFMPVRGLGHYRGCPYGSGTTPRLVRLRADPSKIRVGIRRVNGYWLVNVGDREGRMIQLASHQSPARAVLIALERAKVLSDLHGLNGLNPDLEWVYDHPQYREAKET